MHKIMHPAAIMYFPPEPLYNNVLLLCCLVGGSLNNNTNAEAESHEVGSNRPACASCKHQRKKCVEGDCVMWRHFPASKMDEFLGVHKVFGISNVTKKIKSLDDVSQQDEAIKSFLWEARLWQEDPVHGPLGEYKKLEQQLKEEQRNKQLQIVELSDVTQLSATTTTSETIRYLSPLALDQNVVAPRENSANSMHIDKEDYNLLNSSVPNYTNLLQWHVHGGESQGTSNGHDLINVGGGNNSFGFEQIRNGFIPRPAGLQGIVHHPATYDNGGSHVQLHQQIYLYNNMDMVQGRRRKEHIDQFGRQVRGRGIEPISTTTSSLGVPIRHAPIISSSSSGPFVNARTMVRPSVGRHVEDGRNQRAEDLAAVLQDFTNYNHNHLSGSHKNRDF